MATHCGRLTQAVGIVNNTDTELSVSSLVAAQNNTTLFNLMWKS